MMMTRLTPAQQRRAARHVGLAKCLARPMQQRRPDAADDLESAALWGLTQAAGRWRRARGVKFSTYAKSRINGAMLDALEKLRPYGYRELPEGSPRVVRMTTACEEHHRKGPGPPGPPEIAIAREEEEAIEARLARLRKAAESRRAPDNAPANPARKHPAKPLDNARKPDPPPARPGSR